jgi:3-ketosteroid 9alpha-monooxygenase subunit A
MPVSSRNFPPFPNGWFAVAFSSELRPGAVRSIRAFGRELVLFRTQAGKAAVLDAHCPHLGAHLGDGCVVDETIECPYHRWRFGEDGGCRSIPYARKIPSQSSAVAWPTAEANGVIQLHYHASGERPSSPPVPFPGFGADGFSTLGTWGYHMPSHPQEIAENTADLSHFAGVHQTEVEEPEHRADGAAFHVKLRARPLLAGRPLPVPATIDMTCHGLGHVTVQLKIGSWVEVTVLAWATPIEAERVEVRHVYVARTGRGSLAPARWVVGQLVRAEAMRQVSQDRRIWSRKVYRSPPRLCEEDRLIGAFRRWAGQFYTG